MAAEPQSDRKLKHPRGQQRVLLQGRVRPETKQHFERMAAACGATRALFLELMIQQLDLDPTTGRPLWWDSAVKDYMNSNSASWRRADSQICPTT